MKRRGVAGRCGGAGGGGCIPCYPGFQFPVGSARTEGMSSSVAWVCHPAHTNTMHSGLQTRFIRIAHTTCNLTKPPTPIPHMHEHTCVHVFVHAFVVSHTLTDTIPFHQYITLISKQHTEKNKRLPHCGWVTLLTHSVTKSWAVLKVSTRQIPGAGTEVQDDSNMYLPQVGSRQTIGFWHPVYCMGQIWVIWLFMDIIT